MPQFLKLKERSADLPGQIESRGDILHAACASNKLQREAVQYLQKVSTERIIAHSESKGA
jgi:hypothetical protein